MQLSAVGTVADNSVGTEAVGFTVTSTAFPIPAGQNSVSSRSLTITPTANTRDNLDEVITVTVTGTVAPRQAGIALSAAANYTINLAAADDIDVLLSASPNPITEDGSGVGAISTITAQLSQHSATTATVTVSTPSLPAAYTQSGATLTIPANSYDSIGTVTITAMDNQTRDGDRDVVVSATLPQPITGVTTNNAATTLEISDDEAIAVTLVVTDADASISENGGSTTITATLSAASTALTTIPVVFIPVSPATAADYNVSANTTLTVAIGATTSTVTVTLTAVNNSAVAVDKTVRVTNGTVTNADDTISDTNAATTVTITEDDAITVTLLSSQTAILEDGGVSRITARLSPNGSTRPVAVTLTAVPTTGTAAVAGDYTLSTSVLTVPAGATESSAASLTAVETI